MSFSKMDKNWRYQLYAVLFCIAFSIYYLVPTVFNFKNKTEALVKQGQPIPLLYKFFPSDQINLGLDLQGGIYLELEVLFDDAIFNQSDVVANSSERFLTEEKSIKGVRIERVAKTNVLRLSLPDAASLKLAEEYFSTNHGDSFRKSSNAPELIFEFVNQSPEAVSATYQQILKWLDDNNIARLDSEQHDGKLFLILKGDNNFADVQSKLQTNFGSQLKAATSLPVYYIITDAYKQDLREQILKQAIDTIRNRIDRYGVSEPAITKVGSDRVAIELPGETDPERALSVILRAGKLEFRLVDSTRDPAEIAGLVAAAKAEKKIGEAYDKATIELINQALKGKIPDDSEIMFELQRDPRSKKVNGGIPFLVKKRADLNGEMLKSAQVSVQDNKPYVALNFKPIGQKLFGELTEKNQGKLLAIILDGNVASAPRINEPIYGGSAQITLGGMGYQNLLREAQDLVIVLKEGALPASLKEATKTVIGPSLGKNSINKGMTAMAISSFIVIAFMIFYYRVSGVVADLALCANLLFILAMLAMMGATLTMPGVAGLVLTIGMAVDSNVIIFERIKEELAAGRSPIVALNEGYQHAMTAVIDGNLTTFASGLVLYQFGTGPVKGFAVTLMIGIATTLFCAKLVSRVIMEYLVKNGDGETISI